MVTAILSSSQQVVILESMNLERDDPENSIHLLLRNKAVSGSQREPIWNPIYVWQSPMMSLSWGLGLFLMASTLHVCTPLIEGRSRGDGVKVCIILLPQINIVANHAKSDCHHVSYCRWPSSAQCHVVFVLGLLYTQPKSE